MADQCRSKHTAEQLKAYAALATHESQTDVLLLSYCNCLCYLVPNKLVAEMIHLMHFRHNCTVCALYAIKSIKKNQALHRTLPNRQQKTTFSAQTCMMSFNTKLNELTYLRMTHHYVKPKPWLFESFFSVILELLSLLLIPTEVLLALSAFLLPILYNPQKSHSLFSDI